MHQARNTEINHAAIFKALNFDFHNIRVNKALPLSLLTGNCQVFRFISLFSLWNLSHKTLEQFLKASSSCSWKEFLINSQALLTVHSLQLIISLFRKYLSILYLLSPFPHAEISQKIDCHTYLDSFSACCGSNSSIYLYFVLEFFYIQLWNIQGERTTQKVLLKHSLHTLYILYINQWNRY